MPFFIALFVFIFLLNQFGMLPFKALGSAVRRLADGRSQHDGPARADRRSAHLDRRFPNDRHRHESDTSSSRFRVLFPINVLDEVVRPLTLAARLFFNIFVGELLFVIVASIIVAQA